MYYLCAFKFLVVEFLAFFDNMTSDYLILQEIESYEYRAAIHRAVSNVKILDDEPFLVEKVGGQSMLREPPASHRVNKVPKHLKTDFQLVSEGIKAIIFEEHENDDDDDDAGLWIDT